MINLFFILARKILTFVCVCIHALKYLFKRTKGPGEASSCCQGQNTRQCSLTQSAVALPISEMSLPGQPAGLSSEPGCQTANKKE